MNILKGEAIVLKRTVEDFQTTMRKQRSDHEEVKMAAIRQNQIHSRDRVASAPPTRHAQGAVQGVPGTPYEMRMVAMLGSLESDVDPTKLRELAEQIVADAEVDRTTIAGICAPPRQSLSVQTASKDHAAFVCLDVKSSRSELKLARVVHEIFDWVVDEEQMTAQVALVTQGVGAEPLEAIGDFRRKRLTVAGLAVGMSVRGSWM